MVAKSRSTSIRSCPGTCRRNSAARWLSLPTTALEPGQSRSPQRSRNRSRSYYAPTFAQRVGRSFTGRKVSMLRSLLPPFRHLPLDHPWIDLVASRVGALSLHLPEHAPIPRLERRGRFTVALRKPALQDLKAPRERERVRV